MSRPRPEAVHVVKGRRDAALSALVASVPYIAFLGVRFDRRGDELTAVMPFDDRLIGNPLLPALHGGAIAAFLPAVAFPLIITRRFVIDEEQRLRDAFGKAAEDYLARSRRW